MKETKKINFDFVNNMNYILFNLKRAIEEANNLEDKIYLELSKEQIIEFLNYAYINVKKWQNFYELKNYEMIINKYKEIESVISMLELCLADYDNVFHIEGIAYSLFQIGKILSNVPIEN